MSGVWRGGARGRTEGAHVPHPRSLSPLSTSVIDEPWLALVRPAISPRRVASLSPRLSLVRFSRGSRRTRPVWREDSRDYSECADSKKERETKISGGEDRAEFIPRATRRSARGRGA